MLVATLIFLLVPVPILAVEPVAAVLGVFAACGGLGGLLGGYAALQAHRDKMEAQQEGNQVDIVKAAHAAMTSHMATLANDNRALREDITLVKRELVGVNEQLRKCQDDKHEMQRENDAWKRRWESQHGPGTATTT